MNITVSSVGFEEKNKVKKPVFEHGSSIVSTVKIVNNKGEEINHGGEMISIKTEKMEVFLRISKSGEIELNGMKRRFINWKGKTDDSSESKDLFFR